MKTALSICVLAAMAMAAPAPSPQESTAEEQPQLLRPKRSNYGGQYTSPCGAASIPIPAIAPAPYQYNLPPVHHHVGYGPSPHYGYGVPHYRADMGEEQEMMGFSDMDSMMSEHSPMARYGYAAPAVGHYGGGAGGIGQLVAPAGSGTAYGVFPNANVGGCAVPLLLSCSPSIVHGKIVKSHQPPYSYGGSAPVLAPDAYRGVDEPHHEDHEHTAEQPQQQTSSAHEASHSGMHQ